MSKWKKRTLGEIARPLRAAAADAGLQDGGQISISADERGLLAMVCRDVSALSPDDWIQEQLLAVVLADFDGKRCIMRAYGKGTGIDDLDVTLVDVEGDLAASGEADAYCNPWVIGGITMVVILASLFCAGRCGPKLGEKIGEGLGGKEVKATDPAGGGSSDGDGGSGDETGGQDEGGDSEGDGGGSGGTDHGGDTGGSAAGGSGSTS